MKILENIMKTEVNKIIKDVTSLALKKNDYLKKALRQLPLNNLVKDLLKKYGYKYEYYDTGKTPVTKLFVNLGSYSNEMLTIKYLYRLEFSKLANVRKDMFSFELNHLDPDSITGGYLSAEESEPLTKTHFRFYEDLNRILDINSLHLDYRDLNEVICDLSYTQPAMKFFSEQPNVEMVLFHDFPCHMDDD